MDPERCREDGDECSEKQCRCIAECFDEKSSGATIQKRTLKDNEILQKCKEGEDTRQDQEEDDTKIEVA